MSEVEEQEGTEVEEPETGEPDPEEEEETSAPEPDEQPEPENEHSEAALLARDKALEREHKSHETRLANIHGSQEWEDYSMCPLCIGDGFLTPWTNQEMPEEQWLAVTALAGQMPTVEYRESTKAQRCEECDGRGKTISGAQPPNDPLKLCDVCGGNGYVPKAPALPTLPQPAQIQNGTDPVPPPSQWGSPQPDDEWGRSAGHPHYGVDPRYAGLTG